MIPAELQSKAVESVADMIAGRDSRMATIRTYFLARYEDLKEQMVNDATLQGRAQEARETVAFFDACEKVARTRRM